MTGTQCVWSIDDSVEGEQQRGWGVTLLPKASICLGSSRGLVFSLHRQLTANLLDGILLTPHTCRPKS